MPATWTTARGTRSEALLGTHHPTHPDLQHDGLRPPSHLQSPTLLHLNSKGRHWQQQALEETTCPPGCPDPATWHLNLREQFCQSKGKKSTLMRQVLRKMAGGSQ